MSPGSPSRRNRRGGGPMEVPARLRAILLAVPVRNDSGLAWETGERGTVTIIHDKDLKRWERWLMKRVGGSPIVRRRLDKYGSDIWRLCDGRHTVAEICSEMDEKYKEEMEPVLTRVLGFLQILLARNLISLKREKQASGSTGGNMVDERPPLESGGLHPIGDASLPPPKGGGLLSDEQQARVGGTGASAGDGEARSGEVGASAAEGQAQAPEVPRRPKKKSVRRKEGEGE